MICHLKNDIVIPDDIMVVGKNHRNHDLALTALLETTKKCNVQLNYNKLQYKKTEFDFFSEIYMINGHKPAQTKVFARTAMAESRCKKEVQSFLGMINYLSKFSARLSELSEPIRELFKKVNWGHQKAFNAIKKQIVKAPILAYYDPNKETI